MPKLEGFTELVNKLNRMVKRAEPNNVSVQVGFTQSYALIVHEDMEAYHTVGQAKYLETPARSLKGELTRIIRKSYAKMLKMGTKNPIEKSLILVGLRLQREAQKLTPVDTSALKASAYTAVEREADTVAMQAFQKSEKIRKAAGG